MAAGIVLAMALLAGSPDPAAATGPATAEAESAPRAVDAPCVTPLPDAGTTTIVVCAERPQGYRLNRDVMEAHREKHGAGRPTPARDDEGR
jgi:hypothetical protein